MRVNRTYKDLSEGKKYNTVSPQVIYKPLVEFFKNTSTSKDKYSDTPFTEYYRYLVNS